MISLLRTTLAAQFGHNTSANPAYNKKNFPSNFSGLAWVDQSGKTIPVDSSKCDDSLNPITPCHVSHALVESLLPGPWYAHGCNWFRGGGGGGHIDIGVSCDSDAWVGAALADMQARGFSGHTIDWYGPNHGIEDKVALRIKTHVASMSGFSYVIQIDQGAYTTTVQLDVLFAYIQANYFNTPGYMKRNGLNVVMFFSTVPGVNYAAIYAKYPSFWIMEGAAALSNSYANGVSDWAHDYKTGVSPTDPYGLVAMKDFTSRVWGSAKPAMLFMNPRFNGTLTRSVKWSAGKMTPGDAGKCWLEQAAFLAANRPPNCLGVQVVWNDYEEGDEIETGIDNELTVNASVTGSVLNWSVSGGTGDESTLHEYDVWASLDGVNLDLLAIAPPLGGKNSFDLSSVPNCTLYVEAVGKPCFSNKVNTGIVYAPSQVQVLSPPPPPPPTTVTLTVTGTLTGPVGGPYTGTVEAK